MMQLSFRIVPLGVFFSLLVLMVACKGDVSHADRKGQSPHIVSDTLRLALDWSPNVLHAPIFWAEMHGYFKEAGLSVDWLSTEIDNYQKKPIQRLLDIEVDLCIGPSEHLFFLAVDSTGQARAEAVATVLQRDQSCFVVKKSSDILRPANLKGKTYVGYNTPLEKQVLEAMIVHDRGVPDFEMITPGRLDVWEALLRDKGDVAWVFSHWEAIMAEKQDIQVEKFYPDDYGVPYGYSSVIMARKERTDQVNKRIATFLKVIDRSIGEMLKETDRSVASKLCAHIDHQNFSDELFIAAAWADIKTALVESDSSNWGSMKTQKWKEWMAWIDQYYRELGRVENLPPSDHFFDNSLLP